MKKTDDVEGCDSFYEGQARDMRKLAADLEKENKDLKEALKVVLKVVKDALKEAK